MALISAEAAASKLDVNLPRLYQLVRTQIVPAVRLGRSLRFDEARLDEFVKTGGAALPGGWRREP
jgi:excisionase family DNA binding protein